MFKRCPLMNVLWVLTCTIHDANAGMITLSLSKTGSSKLVGSCPVLVGYSTFESWSSCGVMGCMETFLDAS